MEDRIVLWIIYNDGSAERKQFGNHEKAAKWIEKHPEVKSVYEALK